ncbi:MAG: hypothetical protein JW839_04570 [Candidatus Lokiarchaeota archaeon]|nr:hypothetical protein [Candidatus Lokiarchaeota archaeon]
MTISFDYKIFQKDGDEWKPQAPGAVPIYRLDTGTYRLEFRISNPDGIGTVHLVGHKLAGKTIQFGGAITTVPKVTYNVQSDGDALELVCSDKKELVVTIDIDIVDGYGEPIVYQPEVTTAAGSPGTRAQLRIVAPAECHLPAEIHCDPVFGNNGDGNAFLIHIAFTNNLVDNATIHVTDFPGCNVVRFAGPPPGAGYAIVNDVKGNKVLFSNIAKGAKVDICVAASRVGGVSQGDWDALFNCPWKLGFFLPNYAFQGKLPPFDPLNYRYIEGSYKDLPDSLEISLKGTPGSPRAIKLQSLWFHKHRLGGIKPAQVFQPGNVLVYAMEDGMGNYYYAFNPANNQIALPNVLEIPFLIGGRNHFNSNPNVKVSLTYTFDACGAEPAEVELKLSP